MRALVAIGCLGLLGCSPMPLPPHAPDVDTGVVQPHEDTGPLIVTDPDGGTQTPPDGGSAIDGASGPSDAGTIDDAAPPFDASPPADDVGGGLLNDASPEENDVGF